MSKLHTLGACESLIDKYLNAGGECVTVEEGALGLGLVVCFGDGLKTTIIKEEPINEWQSGHRVRSYNECPKKYMDMVDKALNAMG